MMAKLDQDALMPIEPDDELMEAMMRCSPDWRDPASVRNAYYSLWLTLRLRDKAREVNHEGQSHE